MKNKILIVFLLVTVSMLCLVGCGDTTSADEEEPIVSEETPSPEPETGEAEPAAADLSGHTLSVYSGAGMTKPFQEIADTFQSLTGCEMEITFANAGQIQTQINTTQAGDLFIAGSADEVAPVQDAVTESTDLVKHIPVIAVKAGNPLGISGLADLAGDEVRVVLGDLEATPLGKIATKAFNDVGITEQVNIVATMPTAPAVVNALLLDECDAVIVWKENVSDESIAIADAADMDPYIKTIPAALLSYCDDEEALAAFLAYLDGDEAHSIWEKYGYEVIE